MVNCSFDIPLGTRVEPKDSYTATKVLGRGRVTRAGGTVVGHAGRGGDYVLVRWDGDECSVDRTVHWANLRSEGGDAYRPDLVVAED